MINNLVQRLCSKHFSDFHLDSLNGLGRDELSIDDLNSASVIVWHELAFVELARLFFVQGYQALIDTPIDTITEALVARFSPRDFLHNVWHELALNQMVQTEKRAYGNTLFLTWTQKDTASLSSDNLNAFICLTFTRGMNEDSAWRPHRFFRSERSLEGCVSFYEVHENATTCLDPDLPLLSNEAQVLDLVNGELAASNYIRSLAIMIGDDQNEATSLDQSPVSPLFIYYCLFPLFAFAVGGVVFSVMTLLD